MKWFYNIPNNKTWKENGTTGIQKILLRPVWEEEKAVYTSGVIDFRITALDFINDVQIQKQLKPEEIAFFKEISGKLIDKEYCIYETELDDDDKNYYLNRIDLYVIKLFNLEQLLNWVRVYLAINGYPCSSIEETDFENFAFDVNPMLRVFSLDNVKKFENKLGYEWWKAKYKHQSDMELVNKLLKNIPNN